MVEETGVVISSYAPNLVEVETVRTSSCTACKAKSACGHHAIAQVSSSNRMRVIATNNVAARVGQRVKIGIPENSLLGASVLMYLVPLISLILGAVLVDVVTSSSSLAALGAIFSFFGSLLFVRQQSLKYQSNPDFHPRVLRVYQEEFPPISTIQL
ncbi:sigma E positive regulator RseC/MucC [Marinomonas agarivorans]|nr:sigma E positive regulator RseC/MucC [Marinomonas agarivorans]